MIQIAPMMAMSALLAWRCGMLNRHHIEYAGRALRRIQLSLIIEMRP
jgi:hypothetical protein